MKLLKKALSKGAKKKFCIGLGVVLVVVVAGILVAVRLTGQDSAGQMASSDLAERQDVEMDDQVPDWWNETYEDQDNLQSIRLTADLVPGITEDVVQEQVESVDWFAGTLNEDGSVTYTMTAAQLEAQQEVMKADLEALQSSLSEQGIEAVVSEDWHEVTVIGSADADHDQLLQQAETLTRQVQLCAAYYQVSGEPQVTVNAGEETLGSWYWTDLQAEVMEIEPVE